MPTTDQILLDPETVQVSKVVFPSKGLLAQQGLTRQVKMQWGHTQKIMNFTGASRQHCLHH